MKASDRAYFERRLSEERDRAETCQEPSTARVHRQLYEKALATGLPGLRVVQSA